MEGVKVERRLGTPEGRKVGFFVGRVVEIRAEAFTVAVLNVREEVRLEVHTTLEGLHSNAWQIPEQHELSSIIKNI